MAFGDYIRLTSLASLSLRGIVEKRVTEVGKCENLSPTPCTFFLVRKLLNCKQSPGPEKSPKPPGTMKVSFVMLQFIET